MKSLCHRILLGFLCAYLSVSITACSGNSYGLSDHYWQSLSFKQRNRIIQDGDRVKLALADDQSKVVVNDKSPKVQIKIKGGDVMMPPFEEAYPFKSVKFFVAEGECKYIPLHQMEGNKEVQLGACFKPPILYLDGSKIRYAKRFGSIRLYESPLWQRGFTYNHINSNGYARLKGVSVWVKRDK